MLFKNLCASTALRLDRYADIDHFRESEKYVRAESIPLTAKDFTVLRASLRMPSCTLSLVRTFPRIINGYALSGGLLIVIPMDDVSSARINGRTVGHSLILLNGSANCTVHEPEGRLVAVLSIRPEILALKWSEFAGYLLLRPTLNRLALLQMLICRMLEFAAKEPGAVHAEGILQDMQRTLLMTIDEAMYPGQVQESGNRGLLERYKTIVDRVDDLLSINPIDVTNEKMASEIGISLRTLQTAVQTICGSGAHRYSRLRRLWSVRRQLRTGAPTLTVRASALAHGFLHMGEFSNAYRSSFGELPSQTLACAQPRPVPRFASS
jgi:AraC family transcriptional regulator, ethanolamine operon transcriptional activator